MIEKTDAGDGSSLVPADGEKNRYTAGGGIV